MRTIQFAKSEHKVFEFNDKSHSRIKVCPMYFKLGFSPSPKIFGRYSVFNRLIKAIDLLPQEYGLLIWDIYRPRSVQGKLFNWMREEIRKKIPLLSDEENVEETKKYMSAPSMPGDEYCPPHLSGGAIDLTLFDIADGKALEMGAPFDDCTERAHSHYFNVQTILSPEDKIIQKRRDLLRSVMEHVGFTSYQYEWWHFDIGNLFWSRIVQHPPVFGPLFGDEEWPINLNVPKELGSINV